MRSLVFGCLALLATIGAAPANSRAVAPARPASETPISYDALTASGTAQHGLFTIWRYKGDVLLELQPDQFGKDFVELGVPVNGIGGLLFSGITDLQNVRIVRFVKQDDKVAILFPSTRFLADPGTPVANAVSVATAPTVVGVAKIVTTNPATGAVAFDASSLLGDVTDIGDALSQIDDSDHNPMAAYRIDPSRSYFGITKAFPQNVTITANQTFDSRSNRAPTCSASLPTRAACRCPFSTTSRRFRATTRTCRASTTIASDISSTDIKTFRATTPTGTIAWLHRALSTCRPRIRTKRLSAAEKADSLLPEQHHTGGVCASPFPARHC